MPFCTTHFLFYRYGQCPKCLRAQVVAQLYANIFQLNNRFHTLLGNPDQINQDRFGVCGTTSAVYLLVRHRQAAALNLHQATFADIHPPFARTRFNTARHGPVKVDFTYLSRRFRLLEQNIPVTAAAAAAAAAVGVTTAFFLDYCLSRALGYVFKQVAADRYAREKMEFNTEFDPLNPLNPQDYRNVTRAMGFALRSNNLAFIMHDILGANGVHVASKAALTPPVVPLAAPVIGVSQSTFNTVAGLNNQFAVRFNNPASFALAAIYAGPGGLVPHAPGHVAAASAGHARLTYNHWVLITAFNVVPAVAGAVCPNAHVNLQIWTWGQFFNLQVCDIHLLSYIQDIIFGTL